jgi:hypothetical protein
MKETWESIFGGVLFFISTLFVIVEIWGFYELWVGKGLELLEINLFISEFGFFRVFYPYVISIMSISTVSWFIKSNLDVFPLSNIRTVLSFVTLLTFGFSFFFKTYLYWFDNPQDFIPVYNLQFLIYSNFPWVYFLSLWLVVSNIKVKSDEEEI